MKKNTDLKIPVQPVKNQVVTANTTYQDEFLKNLKVDFVGLEKSFRKYEKTEKDKTKLHNVKIAFEKIRSNKYTTKRTNNARIYNPMTLISRDMRKHIGTDLIQIDTANSHPLLLVHHFLAQGIKIEPELIKAVENNTFYDLFSEFGNRNKKKQAVFATFYSIPKQKLNTPIFKILQKKYPVFASALGKIAEGDSLSRLMQKIESNIWIDLVSTHLRKKDISHLTIHDSVVFHPKHINYVETIIRLSYGNINPFLHFESMTGTPVKHDKYSPNKNAVNNFNINLKDTKVIPDNNHSDFGNVKKLEQFPVEIFPKNIQHYIKECNEVFNESIDYMGASFLWMLSVIIGNSIHVQVKYGWSDPAILWIAIIGIAGVGKSPAIKKILFPLQNLNIKKINQFNKDFEAFGDFQALTKKEKQEILNQTGSEIVEPTTEQFLIDDVTFEAIAPIHESNTLGVNLFDDELKGWLSSMTRYSNSSALSRWLKTWNGGALVTNRKTATSHIVENTFISILGGIQPGIFEDMYNKESKDSGQLDRLLLVFPNLKAEYFNDNELDPSTESHYIEFVTGMFDKIRAEIVQYDEFNKVQPTKAKLTIEAKKEYKRIYNWLTDLINSNTENEYLKSMYPKMQRYLGRFALLIDFAGKYAYGGDIDSIDADSILKAEKLVHYFIAMSQKVKIESSELKTMEQIINDMNGRSRSDIVQAVYNSDTNFSRVGLAKLLEVSTMSINRDLNK